MNTSNTGYNIYLNNRYKLTGKITLPTTINGISITGIGTMTQNFSAATAESGITHIFWADPPTDEIQETSRALAELNARAFMNLTTLVYYEQPDTCRKIDIEAFSGCVNLGKDNSGVIRQILNPVTTLGD